MRFHKRPLSGKVLPHARPANKFSSVNPPRSWDRDFEHHDHSFISEQFFLNQLAQNMPR